MTPTQPTPAPVDLDVKTVTITLTQQQADNLWGELHERIENLIDWTVSHPEAEERYPTFWRSNQNEIIRLQDIHDIVYDALYDENGNWK